MSNPAHEEAKRELLKDPVIRDFIQIQEEIQTYQERLKRVELNRSSVRQSVYERVKGDYTKKIKDLLKKVQPQKAKLKSRLEDMEREHRRIEQTLDRHKEELEEARLRHIAGEYTDAEFKPISEEIEVKIAEINDELQRISIDMDIYRDYLGIEIAPELLQEVAQELEAETSRRRGPGERTPLPGPVSAPAAKPEPAEVIAPAPAELEPREIPPEPVAEVEEEEEEEEELAPAVVAPEFAEEELEAAEFEEESELEEISGDELFDDALDFGESGPRTYIPEAELEEDFEDAAIEAALSADEFSLDDLEEDQGESTIRRLPDKAFELDSEEDDEFARYLEDFDDESPTLLRDTAEAPEEFEEEGPAVIPILEVVEGDYAGQSYPITSNLVKIGRGPDNDIQLGVDTSVSRHHAQLVLQDGRYKLIDLNSSNGTFINGIRTKEQFLSANDQVMIGKTRMIFKIPQ
jgi:hypothetical protein